VAKLGRYQFGEQSTDDVKRKLQELTKVETGAEYFGFVY